MRADHTTHTVHTSNTIYYILVYVSARDNKTAYAWPHGRAHVVHARFAFFLNIIALYPLRRTQGTIKRLLHVGERVWWLLIVSWTFYDIYNHSSIYFFTNFYVSVFLFMFWQLWLLIVFFVVELIYSRLFVSDDWHEWHTICPRREWPYNVVFSRVLTMAHTRTHSLLFQTNYYCFLYCFIPSLHELMKQDILFLYRGPPWRQKRQPLGVLPSHHIQIEQRFWFMVRWCLLNVLATYYAYTMFAKNMQYIIDESIIIK